MVRTSGATVGAYTEEVTVVHGTHRAISWDGILAGAITALILHALINMLGVAIGFGVVERVDPAMAEEAAAGTAVWWAAAGILSAFAGGLVAGAFSPAPPRSMGILHGLGAWAVSTLVVLLVIGSITGFAVDQAISGMQIPGAAPEMPEATQAAPPPDPDMVAGTALYAFLSLVIGAIAAAIGGWIGTSPKVHGETVIRA
jgi:hypothetical protein